jgi:hypothetical protein
MILAAAYTYLGLFAGLTILRDPGGGGFDGGGARLWRWPHIRVKASIHQARAGLASLSAAAPQCYPPR